MARALTLLFFLFAFTSQAFALHDDLENQNYTRSALVSLGAVTGIYLTSEMESGPALFAGIYSIGTLYLMREWYKSEEDLDHLIVPFGLLTLAVVNASLLSNNDKYTHHDVFVYNLAGAGLITAYAIWEHAQMTPGERRRRNLAWAPLLNPGAPNGTAGLSLTYNY